MRSWRRFEITNRAIWTAHDTVLGEIPAIRVIWFQITSALRFAIWRAQIRCVLAQNKIALIRFDLTQARHPTFDQTSLILHRVMFLFSLFLDIYMLLCSKMGCFFLRFNRSIMLPGMRSKMGRAAWHARKPLFLQCFVGFGSAAVSPTGARNICRRLGAPCWKWGSRHAC